ncbi:MAG: mannonate dehydratase, partial [Alphaproteobacteria bacterium]
LTWDVVESLPVSENIKKQDGNWREHIANYKTSLRNIADAGIGTICYNFMPILDWTRTDIAYRVASGGTCMRFDYIDFAVFDIYILKRKGAAAQFEPEIAEAAARRHAEMSDTQGLDLAKTVAFGLPGTADNLNLADLEQLLAEYADTTADQLRARLFAFLEEVIPVAQDLNLKMCCHPDDPPFPLLGLPRIASTQSDYLAMMAAVDLPANGITLCTGSLGSRPDNDLPAMMDRLGERVHFLHLRNVKREGTAITGSFFEAEHLGGDTDMVAIIAAVLRQEARRRRAGRDDYNIPMRPDHGQSILDDLHRSAQPGYPAIGRLRGLAELRGIMTALSHPAAGPVA